MHLRIRAKILIPSILLLGATVFAVAMIAYTMQARILEELMRSTTDSKLKEVNPGILAPARISALAKAIGVDEIHVTNEKGVLRWGTSPAFTASISAHRTKRVLF
jgi:hypothetical protein